MRLSALCAAVLAAPFALPQPAAAGAFLTFSGVADVGSGNGAFGLGANSDLSGLAFSGSLRAGGLVFRGDSFAFGADEEYLIFTRAVLTFTINGVTESAEVELPPGEPPFEFAVFNGINPRFGLSDGCCDDTFVAIDGASPTAFALLDIAVLGDAEAIPGGLAPFSVTTDGALINGGLFAMQVLGPNDSRGFFLAATLFTLDLVSVPGPGAAALLGIGLFGLAGVARRRPV